jgi:uncharacterized DUF497 family protein
VIQVKKLIWDSWNIKHIARHNVTTEEVEAVCHGLALILRGKQKGRLLLTGSTEEKRMVSVVLESQGNGSYYPITAYDADSRDITLYNRLKGGDKNERDKD